VFALDIVWEGKMRWWVSIAFEAVVEPTGEMILFQMLQMEEI